MAGRILMAVFRTVERISRVKADYVVTHADPIVLKAGDVITLGPRDTEWPEFIWCTSAEGKSGWVADTVFERHGRIGIASRDYSAVELAVAAGEVVTIVEELGGWSRCTNEQGESGWVPDTHLSK
jgi:hypothetical protein